MIVTVTMNPAVDETLTVPRLELGETNRIVATEFDPGGKGLNVSRVVDRLGRPTVAVVMLGGETGQFVRSRLQREDVDLEVVELDCPTRINISILDETAGVQTNFNNEGAPVRADDIDALDAAIDRLTAEATVMVFGGSLPPGVPSDIYRRLIDRVQAADTLCVLDTSGQALIEGIEARPHLIKPNLEEVSEILGREIATEAEAVEAGRELLARGIAVVVVSMGAEGAVAVTEDGVWRAVPPDVEVRSVVGAGDSMVAGLAIGLAEQSPIAQGLILATAAAAATVMTPGTDLCRPDDVQLLLDRVKVEKI